MKLHEKLGVAIADAGYTWTPKMRSAWEKLDRQTKPLSDEEIRKIAIQCDAYDNDGSLITDDICIDKFARAIEERHGIK